MVTEAKRNGLPSAEEAASLTDVPNNWQSGERLGNWLTKEQAWELLAVPVRSEKDAAASTSFGSK